MQEYVITYGAVDGAGNVATTVTRTVVVTDTMPPLLILQGDNPVDVAAGAVYQEPGALAQDLVDGDLSTEVIIGGDTVDTAQPGTYVVTYNVRDASGNAAEEVRRVVRVNDPITSDFHAYLPLIRP